LWTRYAWLVGDREGIVAMSGEGGVSSKAKVDVCLGCPLSIRGSKRG